MYAFFRDNLNHGGFYACEYKLSVCECACNVWSKVTVKEFSFSSRKINEL
jgi:hypothetical protein